MTLPFSQNREFRITIQNNHGWGGFLGKGGISCANEGYFGWPELVEWTIWSINYLSHSVLEVPRITYNL